MLNLLRACSIYGEHALFMVDMLNLWRTCSIYGEHTQFFGKYAQCIENMLNLWWTCSTYGEHAQLKVNMLNLWWTCSIYGKHAQFMVSMLNLWLTCSFYGEHAYLISWLDWPWKTTLKWLFECPNPSTGSKDTMKSADLYSHSQLCLMSVLALKNYPKMTLWMSKSIHWIKRYSDIYFEVSWFVQTQLIVLHD